MPILLSHGEAEDAAMQMARSHLGPGAKWDSLPESTRQQFRQYAHGIAATTPAVAGGTTTSIGTATIRIGKKG